MTGGMGNENGIKILTTKDTYCCSYTQTSYLEIVLEICDFGIPVMIYRESLEIECHVKYNF